jgi:hypothetical protein
MSVFTGIQGAADAAYVTLGGSTSVVTSGYASTLSITPDVFRRRRLSIVQLVIGVRHIKQAVNQYYSA